MNPPNEYVFQEGRFVVRKITDHPLDPEPVGNWWAADLQKRVCHRFPNCKEALDWLWHYLDKEIRVRSPP